MTLSTHTLQSLDSIASLDSDFFSEPPATLTATFVRGLTHHDPLGPPQNLIELRFSARNLLNADLLSLSDPFAVVYTERHGKLTELGRTETVLDDLNPRWTNALVVPANVRGELVVDVYDRDGATHALSKHDHLGRARFALSDTIGLASSASLCAQPPPIAAVLQKAPDAPRRYRLTHPTPRGHLRVTAEPLRRSRGHRVELRVRAAGLRRRRRDAVQFWEVARACRTKKCDNVTEWTTVYRSEDGMNVDSHGYVRFRAVRMGEQLLHNEDDERMLRFTFYARQTRKEHTVLATYQCKAGELKRRAVEPLRPGDEPDDLGFRTSSVSGRDEEHTGEFYIEEVAPIGDTTVIAIMCDFGSPRGYTSTTKDTSVAERVVRSVPSFIKLH